VSYFVTWTIDIEDAQTPEEAAQRCRDIMLDPESEAVVYEVLDNSTGVKHVIDLMELNDPIGCRFPGPPLEDEDSDGRVSRMVKRIYGPNEDD
jgi:hypothetical protein